MNKLLLFSYTVLLISVQLSAQDQSIDYFPDELHFKPIRADYQEPRTGIVYIPKNDHVNFNLGQSFDVISFGLDENSRLTFGVDISAYAQFNFVENLEINVDNIDALYGLNWVYSNSCESSTLFLRLRLMHNSSHLVDEHFDEENERRFYKTEPFNLTQEFMEFTTAYESYSENTVFRIYGSPSYRIRFFPEGEFTNYFAKAGAELAFKNALGNIMDEETHLFFAANFRIDGTPKYRLSFNGLFGIKSGDWFGKGILFYLSYYRGNNFYSEYYFERIADYGIGCFLELQ